MPESQIFRLVDPILWTIIRLWLRKARYKAQTDLLRNWLSRAANYPISFSLDATDDLMLWVSRHPVEILTLLASFSARWKEVRFMFPDTACRCFDAIPSVKKSLPLLTAATVHLTVEQQLDLSMAPQLSVLHLYNFGLSDILAPWHQLQELLIDSCSTDEMRQIFPMPLR